MLGNYWGWEPRAGCIWEARLVRRKAGSGGGRLAQGLEGAARSASQGSRTSSCQEGRAARRMFICTQEVRQGSKGHDGKGKATLK